MVVNSLVIKLKVLGVGVAVVLCGMVILGNSRAASAATVPAECATGEILKQEGICGPEKIEPSRPAAYDFMSNIFNIPPEQGVFNSPAETEPVQEKASIMGVPLPFAWPLFGAALIGIGYLGRRRKPKAVQED